MATLNKVFILIQRFDWLADIIRKDRISEKIYNPVFLCFLEKVIKALTPTPIILHHDAEISNRMYTFNFNIIIQLSGNVPFYITFTFTKTINIRWRLNTREHVENYLWNKVQGHQTKLRADAAVLKNNLIKHFACAVTHILCCCLRNTQLLWRAKKSWSAT